jgi:hypothetical protein
VLAHSPGLVHSKFKYTLCTRGQLDLGEGRACADTGKALNHGLYPLFFQAQLAQDAPGNATIFTQKTDQNMFTADVAMIEPLGFFLGQA